MSEKEMMLTLAKVIIAAAWADGEMSHPEVNSLKEMLLWSASGRQREMEISQREWAMLEMYIDAPIEAAEREQLVQQLESALRTPKDRESAISALTDIVQADGTVTADERAAVEEIKSALQGANLGVFGQLGRLVRSTVSNNALEREQYLDDFIKNRVYFAVQREVEAGGADLELPDEELRKLSLAGALMARVAQVDREVSETEFDQMVEALQAGWEISPDAATFVANVAVSKINPSEDYFRLISEFANSTTMDERGRFLEVLFAVADADGGISYDETEEIRHIANILLLPHERFIEAKLKISRRESKD
jgi:uncharacterized tellurite resistance protein B-like protein